MRFEAGGARPHRPFRQRAGRHGNPAIRVPYPVGVGCGWLVRAEQQCDVADQPERKCEQHPDLRTPEITEAGCHEQQHQGEWLQCHLGVAAREAVHHRSDRDQRARHAAAKQECQQCGARQDGEGAENEIAL